MNLTVFLDVETSGMVAWRDPSEAPHQPHIVQLAALLVDLDTRKTVASMDVIVRPDGWTIPDDVVAIHGITNERAMEVGVPESLALQMLLALAHRRTRVAHSITFDDRVVRIGLLRHATERVADEWKAGATHCTQRLSSPILKLGKTPSLAEAYRGLTGRELVGAHTALADATACRDVYFAVLDLQAQQQREPEAA